MHENTQDSERVGGPDLRQFRAGRVDLLGSFAGEGEILR